MTETARKIITQNIKLIKILKSTNHTDREIAKTLGVSVTDIIEMVETDDYFREIYEEAGEKVINEIEAKYLTKVLENIEKGKMEDARFVLSKRHPDYKTDTRVEISVKSIDEIIKEKSLEDE